MNQSKTIFDFTNYMTIEALEDGVSVFCARYVQYGIDGVGWKDSNSEIIINTGQLLSIKCELSQGDVFGTIEINGRCNLKGNCLSLIFGDKAKNNNDLSGYSRVFKHLFHSNDGILNIEKTFLPAITLADECYSNMFYNCTSLTTAPELPAITLAYYCYAYMFYNCSKLNYIKAMFTTTPESGYTSNWLSGVDSTGTFVKNKDATWDVTGENGVPEGWTVITYPMTIQFSEYQENINNYNMVKYLLQKYPDMVVSTTGEYTAVSEDIEISGCKYDGKVIGIAKWSSGSDEAIICYTESSFSDDYGIRVIGDYSDLPKGATDMWLYD